MIKFRDIECWEYIITQDWELNEFGTFQKILDDCLEVTHEPDRDDVWDCAKCGYSGAGSEFVVSQTNEKP